MEIQNIRAVYIRIMHLYYNMKLTENSIIFCILFSRRLSFWNLDQMSWLNNYMLEDACRSRQIRCFCSGCHYSTCRWRLTSLHVHMHVCMCIHFIHLIANSKINLCTLMQHMWTLYYALVFL